MEWGVFMLIAAVASIATMAYTSHTNSVRQNEAFQQQKELMREQAPLAMEGYERAGLNPWAAGTSPISSSTPSSPSMPYMDESGLSMLPNLLNSMSGADLNEARVGETYVKTELGKANISLVESKIGLTNAEAVVAVAKNAEIRANIDYLRDIAENVRAKTKTEGFIQDNYAAQTNAIGETAQLTKQQRLNALLDGQVTQFNIDYVLPSVAAKAFYDANLSKEEVAFKKQQVAELFNNVVLGSMDVERALITYSQDMATHIFEREAANGKAFSESREEQMKAGVWGAIDKDMKSKFYLQGQHYLEIMFGPGSRTIGKALGGQSGSSMAKLFFKK